MLKAYEEYYKTPEAIWYQSLPNGWKNTKMRSVFSERVQKVSDREFPALSVGKMGVVPQLETAVKTDNGDNRKLICKGDFAINSRSDRKGSSGISYYTGSASLIITVLKVNKQLNSRYYHYLLKSNGYVEEFYRNGHGLVSDLWTTKWSEMRNIYIPVPPKPEQNQIVRYLDWKTLEMNRFIHQKKKQIKMLEELKQTIINKTVFSGIRGEELKDSNYNWIPDIPKSWKLLKAKCLFEEIVDTGYGNELPLLSITNKDGVVLQSKTGRKMRMSEDSSSYKRIKPGDIGYNLMNAFIGSLGVSEYDGLISPAYAVCRPIVPLVSKYFEYVYKTPQFMQEFDNNSYGIMIERNRLYFDSFKQIVTPVPPYHEQVEIVEYLNTKLSLVDKMIDGLRKEIELVEELKVKLISDVVTGQVDVRNEVIPNYEVDSSDDEVEDDVDEESSDENIDEE